MDQYYILDKSLAGLPFDEAHWQRLLIEFIASAFARAHTQDSDSDSSSSEASSRRGGASAHHGVPEAETTRVVAQGDVSALKAYLERKASDLKPVVGSL